MKNQLIVPTTLALFCTFAAWCQNQDAGRENAPIYRVTVVERTVKAVDYQYRNGPTMVDFRGTVLLPKAKGHATVESKAGRTEIDARFEHVESPSRYGPEYLTYVLWAITPEGHAKNLGEVLANGTDHASLHVTTGLQAFGMIVTAEPYSAVRDPSDVVVMENEIRPDTAGQVEQVSAKFDLLPRGHYTMDVQSGSHPPAAGPPIPMDRYEEIVEVYQAQNAVQIARATGADKYAPDTLGKAEQLLKNAQDFQVRRSDKSNIITAARQAAQTADDARAITIKRKHDEELALAQDQLGKEKQLRAQAEAEAQRLKAEASADRMQLEAERSETTELRNQPPGPPPQPAPAPVPAAPPPAAHKSGMRVTVLRDLNAAMSTLDTPRGLVVTVANSDFRGNALSPSMYANLGRVAAVIAAHPGLYVQVEGHTDSTGNPSRDEQLSLERAAAVRDALLRSGVPAAAISARGVGGTRPLASDASAAGREQNRRVEITISGDPIGSVPYWDKTYALTPSR